MHRLPFRSGVPWASSRPLGPWVLDFLEARTLGGVQGSIDSNGWGAGANGPTRSHFGSCSDRPKICVLYSDMIARRILCLGICMKYMSRFMIDQVNWFENVFEQNLCVSMDAG